MTTHLRFCYAEIPTLVLLTKIDAYDPDVVGQDLKKTFHSERLLTLVEVSSYIQRECRTADSRHCAPAAVASAIKLLLSTHYSCVNSKTLTYS